MDKTVAEQARRNSIVRSADWPEATTEVCPAAKSYQGRQRPRCCNGNPCRACREIYVKAELVRRYGR